MPALSRPLALVVGCGTGRGGEGNRRQGAKCGVSDGKGRGPAGFGAGHCRVVTLQEVLVHLAVSLFLEEMLAKQNNVAKAAESF